MIQFGYGGGRRAQSGRLKSSDRNDGESRGDYRLAGDVSPTTSSLSRFRCRLHEVIEKRRSLSKRGWALGQNVHDEIASRSGYGFTATAFDR